MRQNVFMCGWNTGCFVLILMRDESLKCACLLPPAINDRHKTVESDKDAIATSLCWVTSVGLRVNIIINWDLNSRADNINYENSSIAVQNWCR